MKEAIGGVAIVHRYLLQLGAILGDSLQTAADRGRVRTLQIAPELRCHDRKQSVHSSLLGGAGSRIRSK
jgi:hypothetical protein